MTLTKVVMIQMWDVPREQVQKRREEANAQDNPSSNPVQPGTVTNPGPTPIDGKPPKGESVDMNQINIGMRAEEGKREEGIGPGPRSMPNQNTDDDDENDESDDFFVSLCVVCLCVWKISISTFPQLLRLLVSFSTSP